ncbi:MAG TPA: hypothetical protein VMV60_04170 [Thermoanaerobaculia bacterium]|nr:hypothetical protein [Thermoanaerobaculia bacterium]
MTVRGFAAPALAFFVLAAGSLQAQTPALSGLSPTPEAPAATSAEPTPVPTPAPKLRGVTGPASQAGHPGQSLADVVRLSKEARKGQAPRKSLGTITNDTLVKGGAATPSATPAKGKGATKAAPGAVHATHPTPAPTPAPTYDVPRDDKGRSEAEWRGMMNHAQALVADGDQRVKDLETKSRQLENDFYAQSDGYRRDGVIKPAWDKAREELAKARTDLEAARKSLDDLSEEARRSGAPPGWLR